MAIKTLILALALCVPSWATVYYLSPQGSDSNTCLGPAAGQACKTPNHLNGMLHAGDVVQIRTGVYSLPTLQGGPWTPTDSGSPGNPIVWENYSADLPNIPVITGTTNPGTSLGTFTINGAPPTSCVSPACTDYQVDLDANVAHNPHFVKFESLFYNGVRRSVPKQIYKNNAPNSNNATMCFAGANAAAADVNMSCPAGVSGRAAPYNHCAFQSSPCSGGTPWMSFNKCMYSGTDVSGSFHNIGLGDVEISLFEIWSMSRQRLLSASGGVMNFTGATAVGNGQAGCMPGHDYIVSNAIELAQASQWYLDRCPTNPACVAPENTWRLHIYTAPGENPNVDTIYFPQMDALGDTRIVVASGLHDVSWYGITFEGDNWYPDALGLPDFQGIPLVEAALSFTASTNITLDSDQIYHVQGWGVEFVGAGTGDTIKNSVIYDTGAGGIRIGAAGLASDTEGNIPSQISITQNKVDYTGRIQPTGEATAISIRDAHHVTVDHNETIGNFSGGISNDCGLNRGALGGTTAYHCHDNFITNNLVVGQCTSGNCIGILNDFGCIYLATNLSPNAPNTTTDPGTTKAQYAIFVEGNVCHDMAHNFTNSTAAGARGIYFDQGTSYVWVDNNLVYRIGQECFFNNTPSHGNGNPAAPYLAQYNRVFNNIFALCGASSANAWRIVNRGGDNLSSFTFTKNIGFFNSSVGATPQSQPGHWGCFDYSGGSPVGTACINAWVFSNNIWWDSTNSGTVDFAICTGSNCNAGQPYTHFSTVPWSGEDAGSKITDPRFINPTYPTDNWHPTNYLAMSQVGFVPFEYSTAGANLNFTTVPTAPSFYSSRTISATTDYITGYTPHPVTTWGIPGSVSGLFTAR